MNFNRVILVGNLTEDPRSVTTQGKTSICSFTLAVNRFWKGRDGQQNDEVSFIDVKAFGKQAETINQYVNKGQGILVEGRLQQERWDGKDGRKNSKVVVVVENFQFLSGISRATQPTQNAKPRKMEPSTPQPGDLDKSDVPF